MKFSTNSVLCLLAFLFSIQVQAQSWTERTNTEGKPANFYEIQKSFNSEWQNKEITRSQGFKPYKRWEYYWETRVNEDGSFPDAGKVEREWQSYLRSHPGVGADMAANWTSLGPNSNSSGYAGTGRIGAVAFHPTNTNLFYVGTPGGGIWKTTDGGTSWTPLLDDKSSIGVSSIVVDQNNPNTIYVATGDGDGKDTYSIGVLKSTDGGNTWNTTGLSWNTSAADVIYRMIMDPNDSNTLMLASNIGIYRTTNGGTSWTQEKSGNYYDIMAKPDAAASTFYAVRYSSSTVYVDRSTDNGNNWTQTYSTGGRRGSLAVSPNNANYVYLLVAATNNGFGGMYRSTNSGTSFALRSNSPNILGHNADGSSSGGQGWYDLCAAADPLNAEIVYIGGVNCWKSTNGGTSWTIKSHWSSTNGGTNQVVHADKHALFWQNNTTLFEGNDGGVYKTTNGGNNWTDVTGNLVISQMYKIGVSQTDSKVIAGLQDNGTKARTTGGTWLDEVGGDGMECAINPTNSNIMYGSLYYGQIRRSTNGGGSWSTITNSLPGGAWVTPYTLDPNTPSTIYVGIQDLYKSTNQGSTWTSIASTTSSDLRIVVVAPSNSNYIYIGTSSSFWRTTNGGTSWSSITAPSTSITSIAVSPTDPNTLYATRGSFSNGNKVFKSTNGGASWTNISGSLPNIPANTIVYQNNTSEGLYLGMDVGVYYRDASMSDWVLYNTNLPNAPVSELEINNNTNKLVAATYGRGVWESDLFAVNSDYITLSPNSVSVSGTTGSTATVAISANVSWTATSNDSWITVSPTSGANDGNITLTIAANPNCSVRTGSVTVSDGVISRNVAVDQGVGGSGIVAPFTESFDGTTIPGCWTMSGSEDWKFTTTWPAYGAANVADHTGNSGSFAGVDGSTSTSSGGGNGSDTHLFTPMIDISGLSNPSLSFFLFSNNIGSPGDNAELRVAVSDGSTWTDELTYSGDDPNWVQQFVDLSTYSGSIQLRFTIDHTVMVGDPWDNDIVIDDVSVTDVVGCSGAPNSGFASGPASIPCEGESFSILLSGQDIGPDISLQWESSSNGSAWTAIAGQTTPTLTTSTFTNTDYRANVFCSTSGISGYSNSITVTPSSDVCLCSCTSNSTSSVDTKIDSITFNGVSFGSSSTSCETYTSHTSTGLTFSAGETINVDVRNGSCSGNHYDAILAVYIDWNGDKDFDDAGENVHTSAQTTALNTLSPFTITVPAAQATGSVKMRFVLAEGSSAESGCSTFTYGETEDYCVDIVPTSACDQPLSNVRALINNATTAVIDWAYAPDAWRFKVLYREQGSSSWNPVITVRNTPFARRNYVLTGLSNNTTYEYRVRQQCVDGSFGPYSPIMSFTTFDASICERPAMATIGYKSNPSKVLAYLDYEPSATKYNIRWREVGTTTESGKGSLKSKFLISGLNPGTMYEYRWRSECGSGNFTTWSPRDTFVTLSATSPRAVGCSGTPNGGIATSSSTSPCSGDNFDVTLAGQDTGPNFSLQWEESIDGVLWTPISGQTSPVLTTSTTSLMYYRANVNCITSGLSGFSNTVMVTPVSLVMGNVRVLINNASTAVIDWEYSPDVWRFKILYRELGASSWNPVITVRNTPFPRANYVLTGLKSNTTYQYRVRKQCVNGAFGTYSPIQSFTTFDTAPCEQPAAATIGYKSAPDRVLLYLDYEPSATKYNVRWRVAGTTTETGKGFIQSKTLISGLTPNTMYEYRWRSECGTGNFTPWTSRDTFVTLPAPSPLAPVADSRAVSVDSELDVQIFPNPVSDDINILNNTDEQCIVQVFSLQGQVMLDAQLSRGANVFDCSSYTSGAYMIRVIYPKGAVMSKIVVKK